MFTHPTNCIFRSYDEFKEALSKEIGNEVNDELVSHMLIVTELNDWCSGLSRKDYYRLIKDGIPPFNLVESYQSFIELLSDNETAEDQWIEFRNFIEQAS